LKRGKDEKSAEEGMKKKIENMRGKEINIMVPQYEKEKNDRGISEGLVIIFSSFIPLSSLIILFFFA
jgi:DNA-directed RNA polymerase specialized sigma subunit